MKKILFIIIFLVCLFSAYSEQILTYREKTGNDVIIRTTVIKTTSTGYIVENEKSTSWLDFNFETTKFIYKDTETKTDITAQKYGNKIRLEGIHNGKKIKKEYNINGIWIQAWDAALENFVRSNKKSIKFHSLRPTDFEIFEFEAIKQKKENIKVNGKTVYAYYIRLSLTGFMGMWWHANYWFRVSDGRFIYYKAVNGPPGTPETTIELIKEQ